MKKEAKVHMLPTEDTSDIWMNNNGPIGLADDFVISEAERNNNGKYQHLYFTTDEEIKEGDWYINTEEKNGVKNPFYGKLYRANESIHTVNSIYIQNLRKIVATTDPKLKIFTTIGPDGTGMSMNLPQPSQAFIKAYCEQGGFDEVDVEYFCEEYESGGHTYTKIPKLKVDPTHNTITTHRIVEKVYSRDDMKKMWIHLGEQGWGDSSGEGFDKWIKENL